MWRHPVVQNWNFPFLLLLKFKVLCPEILVRDVFQDDVEQESRGLKQLLMDEMAEQVFKEPRDEIDSGLSHKMVQIIHMGHDGGLTFSAEIPPNDDDVPNYHAACEVYKVAASLIEEGKVALVLEAKVSSTGFIEVTVIFLPEGKDLSHEDKERYMENLSWHVSNTVVPVDVVFKSRSILKMGRKVGGNHGDGAHDGVEEVEADGDEVGEQEATDQID